MDAVPHHDGNPQSISMASGPSRNTKRTRENDDEALRIKREKAAERQRRKRERDRNAAGLGGAMGFPSQNGHDAHQQQLQAERQPESVSTGPNFNGEELSPEEQARRDRVRLSARERQRKHRSLVKARKLRELGLDMGNEIMPGMDEVHYRVGPDGHYTQIMPHELQHNPHVPHESSFPQGQGQTLGGQTFASTLLLSFSSAPLLKQHLLRTLSMTNEELTSLEPIIADAWDQWDHQRRLHYQAANAAKAPGRPMPGSSVYPPVEIAEHTVNPYANGDQNQPTPNEFRARFHRPLVAPSPFRTVGADAPATATTSTPTSTGSGPQSDPIDPHLTGAGNGTVTTMTTGDAAPAPTTTGKGRGKKRGG